MISEAFWKDVKREWIKVAPPQINIAGSGLGGEIDPSLLKPWEIPFDQIGSIESAYEAIRNGQDILVNQPTPRILLDANAFERALKKQTFGGYKEACELLLVCELPETIRELLEEVKSRFPILEEANEKFKTVYQADLEQFHEYYIPEALQLVEGYLQYIEAGVSQDIIDSMEQEVIDAIKKLIIGVNDKIDEIYKFAKIEIEARAKALEAMMSMDGYVDPAHKI